MLAVLDEYTRECLAIKVVRRLNSKGVLDVSAYLFFRKGIRCHIRSENGSEFAARTVKNWLKWFGVKTFIIEPGNPLESWDLESFYGKLQDEVLDRESFDTLAEEKAVIESWRREYN